jgi:hypothetical protein
VVLTWRCKGGLVPRLTVPSLSVQVSNIRILKEAMREASFLYAELVQMGASMGFVDVRPHFPSLH